MSDLTVLPVTVEHHREPLGIGETTPRLSWVPRTDLPDWRQAAYELEIEPDGGPVWSSGRVETGESVLVPWGARRADRGPDRPLDRPDAVGDRHGGEARALRRDPGHRSGARPPPSHDRRAGRRIRRL